MNVRLLTEAAKNAEGSRANVLNNSLVAHAAKGFDAHDAEGPTTYTFTDSAGNSLSLLSLILGGVYSGSAVKVYVPLAQNPTPIPTTSGLFTFTFQGILFSSDDDMQVGLSILKGEIEADAGLTSDEKTALESQLSLLTYESIDSDFTTVVNGSSYTMHVTVTTSTGYINISYQRP